jgi:hypothetical protein
MGYLNFQIEHHLFPSMPQYKNAIAAPYVRRFCEKWHKPASADSTSTYDLEYKEVSYFQAWKMMFTNLNQVGKHYYANGIQASAEPEAEKVSITVSELEHAPEPEQDVSSDASPESDDVEHLHLD